MRIDVSDCQWLTDDDIHFAPVGSLFRIRDVERAIEFAKQDLREDFDLDVDSAASPVSEPLPGQMELMIAA